MPESLEAPKGRAGKLEVIFETHATTLDNERGIATGWRGGVLSQEGRRQAALLGERHRTRLPSAVYTSDLRRAVETTRIAFGTTGVSIRADARLRECDYGTLTGMLVDELNRERAGRVGVPFPGGESYLQVVDRTASFLVDIWTRHAGDRVVVIGHSATKFALDNLVLGVPLDSNVRSSLSWQPGWSYVVSPDTMRKIRDAVAERTNEADGRPSGS
jgi:broad specificity phosphatase PhoE